MKKVAFTLIELLIVIVIIAVLAMLLYPVFGRMREKGRQVQCVANLKQLHHATMNFAAANNGRFPYSTTYQARELDQWVLRQGWVSWRQSVALGNTSVRGSIDMVQGGAYQGLACISNGTIFPYVEDVRVYLCPTWRMEAVRLLKSSTVRPVRSYVMNHALNHANMYGLTTGSKQVLFSEAGLQAIYNGRRHAQFGVLTAAGTAPSLSWNATVANVIIYPATMEGDGALMATGTASTTNESVAPVHADGRANAIFADGHVELLYPNQIKAAYDGSL